MDVDVVVVHKTRNIIPIKETEMDGGRRYTRIVGYELDIPVYDISRRHGVDIVYSRKGSMA